MELINVFDYQALAQQRMDSATRDFYEGGSEDEVTLRSNRTAFERIQLRPRVLVDVSQWNTATTVLGVPVSMPILVAPTAYHRLVSSEGELATVRATGTAGTLMVVSTAATRSLEDIAQAASGPLWFQLYVYRDRQVSETLVRRAEAAGYRALVLTVDTPRLGLRERDKRNGFGLPPDIPLANFSDPADSTGISTHEKGRSGIAIHVATHFDPSLTWEAIDWLRSLTTLPIVIKGILTAEDATLAVKHGVAGIIVSNHGGRQLDSVPATIEVLPEVVEAVAGQCEVYLDGGIRRGTDILKALALGARAVLVGRPILWGLAAKGEEGVLAVLEILRSELELSMILAGCPTLSSITPSLVRIR